MQPLTRFHGIWRRRAHYRGDRKLQCIPAMISDGCSCASRNDRRWSVRREGRQATRYHFFRTFPTNGGRRMRFETFMPPTRPTRQKKRKPAPTPGSSGGPPGPSRALGQRRRKSAITARSSARAPRPKRRLQRRANPMSGCARPSTSCRRASSFSTAKAATSSGTRNMPRSTAAAPTCSSRARGCRHHPHRRRSAAIIRKRSAARRSGSPSGSTSCPSPASAMSRRLADGRVILIEERMTDDGGVIGLRVDITELKQREASFRLLFDANPVPMIVCALRRRAHPRRQRCRGRALRL